MKKILVLGYTGQLGSALTNEFSNHLNEYCFTGLNSKDVDINDYDLLNYSFEKYKPELVINTVAYTNVEHAEIEPHLAYKINLFGTENVAKACVNCNANLIHISTDYVFGSIQQKFLDEDEHPNPLNHYGMSKLAGELIVKTIMSNSNCLWYIVRSSSLYGNTPNTTKGTFLLKMLNRLKNKHDVYLNDENYMSPTNVENLSTYLRFLNGNNSGIYHASNYGTTTPYQFILKAVEIIKRNKLSNQYYYENIIKVPLNHSHVQRPRFSFLGTNKKIGFVMPSWEDALESFLINHMELL